MEWLNSGAYDIHQNTILKMARKFNNEVSCLPHFRHTDNEKLLLLQMLITEIYFTPSTIECMEILALKKLLYQ